MGLAKYGIWLRILAQIYERARHVSIRRGRMAFAVLYEYRKSREWLN